MTLLSRRRRVVVYGLRLAAWAALPPRRRAVDDQAWCQTCALDGRLDAKVGCNVVLHDCLPLVAVVVSLSVATVASLLAVLAVIEVRQR